jgi:mannose-6-phosphate isomerase-like protein (cupin superfamily)
MRISRRAIILAAAWLLSLVVVYAYAQKKAKAGLENTSKIVLENDRVRVKDNVFQPGVKPDMHTHTLDHVGVVIEGGALQFNYPDGKVEKLELKTGSVGWRDKNTTHQVINLGSKPVRVIEVELK